ncbi:MAG: hypothetical protein ACQKBY_00515 [Verrucomicrobiales bacterium]
MKRLFSTLALLASPAASAATLTFFEDFDSTTAGDQPAFSTVNEPSSTTVRVTTAESRSGPNSLFIEDSSTATNPNVFHTFGPDQYGQFTYSYDYLRGPSNGDITRTEFSSTLGGGKKLDFRLDGNRLHLKLNSQSDVATSDLFTNIAGANWRADGWNNFTYIVNDLTDTVTANLNGVEILSYTHSSAINWESNRVQIHVGYSTLSPASGYFDNISFTAVPEPAGALLSSLAALSLLRRKR